MDELTLVRVAAFIHPLWMVITLGSAVYTARLGLEIRRRRRLSEPVGGALRSRHLRFGKLSLVLVAIGFVLGPISMIFLRERPGFDSFHSVLGLIVLGLFAWTGWSGRALAGGNQDARAIHRIAAAAAIASGLFAAVAGFILLP